MSSLADEIHFLFSGRGMPYEKVSLLVAIVITVFFTAAMGYNYTRDVNVVVVDPGPFQDEPGSSGNDSLFSPHEGGSCAVHSGGPEGFLL